MYKRLIYSILVLTLAIFITIAWTGRKVVMNFEPCTEEQLIHSNIDTAVVLGIIKTLLNGKENPFYRKRILAAMELKAIKPGMHFIVSGNYNRRGFNEARDIADEMMRLGLDSTQITVDDSSYRTYDTMRRLKQKFRQQKIIIVSQKFHLKRSRYLAEHFEIESLCYVAADPENGLGLRVRLREPLARLKAFIDTRVLSPPVRETSPG